MESTDYLKLLLGLVSIVNPIGAIPVFLDLTRERPDDTVSTVIVYAHSSRAWRHAGSM